MAKQPVVCFQDSLLVLATLGLFISEKVFSFCLGSGSWKGFLLSSIRSSWKFLYAVSPRALAVRRSFAMSEGATVLVERLISSVGSPLNGLIHSVSIKSTRDCTASSTFLLRDDSKSWWVTPGGLISGSSLSCFRQVLLYFAVNVNKGESYHGHLPWKGTPSWIVSAWRKEDPIGGSHGADLPNKESPSARQNGQETQVGRKSNRQQLRKPRLPSDKGKQMLLKR